MRTGGGGVVTVQVSQDGKLLDDVVMLPRLLQHPLHARTHTKQLGLDSIQSRDVNTSHRVCLRVSPSILRLEAPRTPFPSSSWGTKQKHYSQWRCFKEKQPQWHGTWLNVFYIQANMVFLCVYVLVWVILRLQVFSRQWLHFLVGHTRWHQILFHQRVDHHSEVRPHAVLPRLTHCQELTHTHTNTINSWISTHADYWICIIATYEHMNLPVWGFHSGWRRSLSRICLTAPETHKAGWTLWDVLRLLLRLLDACQTNTG